VIAALRAYSTLAAAAQARDAATEKLERAQQVLAAVDRLALVLTLDQQGRIIEANDQFCRVAGMTQEQLRRRDLHAIHAAPFPETLVNEIKTALSVDGKWEGEIAATLASGPCHLHCSVLAFKGTEGAVQRYVAVATPLDHTG
jgi:PAS domain-containing protein